MKHSDFSEMHYYRGRVAQTALLRALDIGSGDHVAIQAFTCVAVPEGVIATGARPLYIDIEATGYNMSPESLAERITAETRAIIVQHTFGMPAEMGAIMRIADERGIPVIEDCCHTFLSSYRGRTVGSFGAAAFYSFEWGKPVVVGLGGATRVNDRQLAVRLDAHRSAYKPPSITKRMKIELQYHMFGMLYWPRLYWPVRGTFHALARLGAAEGNFNVIDGRGEAAPDFGLCMAPHLVKRLGRRLRSVDRIATQSAKITEFYRNNIHSQHVAHPSAYTESHAVFARYPLRVQDKPAVLSKARKANVELAEWYSTPIHPIPIHQGETIGYHPGSCPEAEARSREIVSLPAHSRVGQGYMKGVSKFFAEL